MRVRRSLLSAHHPRVRGELRDGWAVARLKGDTRVEEGEQRRREAIALGQRLQHRRRHGGCGARFACGALRLDVGAEAGGLGG